MDGRKDETSFTHPESTATSFDPSDRPIIRRRDGFGAGERSYACKSCDESFALRSRLNQHSRVHRVDKSHVCELCADVFFSVAELRASYRAHAGEDPRACGFCGETIVRSGHVKRIRPEDKPYVCEVCCRTFARKSHMTTHLRAHSREIPYSCGVCCCTFSPSCARKNHPELHANGKPPRKLERVPPQKLERVPPTAETSGGDGRRRRAAETGDRPNANRAFGALTRDRH